jgi:hypothetical protein
MRAMGSLAAFGLGVACRPAGPPPATPVPVTEVRVADNPEPPPRLVCPEGWVRDDAATSCLRVVHTGDAPAWKPPPGDASTYDPCGAWSDPVGLVNCDPGNETASAPSPDAGGRGR